MMNFSETKKITKLLSYLFTISSLLSCNNSNSINSKTNDTSVVEVSKIPIDETKAVIHNLPFSFQRIDDSLVGFKVNAINYNIYNAYNGKVIKHIELDSQVIPNLISRVAKKYSTPYKFTYTDNIQGIQPTEISEMVVKGDSAFLFFTVFAYLDSTISHNGEMFPAMVYKKLNFVAIGDKKMDKVYKYFFIELNGLNPIFSDGLYFTGNKFFVQNLKVDIADSDKNDLMVEIRFEDDICKCYSIPFLYDERTLNLAKSHQLKKMSYSNIGNSILFSDEKRLMILKDSNISKLSVSINEQDFLQNMEFNSKDSLLVFHTMTSNNSSVTSKINSLDFKSMKLKELYKFSGLSRLVFLSSSRFVLLTQGKEKYQFIVYDL